MPTPSSSGASRSPVSSSSRATNWHWRGGPPQPGREDARSDYAQSLGYTVVDALSVMGTHFAEVAKRHAHELFTRQDAKAYCDRVLQEQPKLVEELSPKHLVTVQRV